MLCCYNIDIASSSETRLMDKGSLTEMEWATSSETVTHQVKVLPPNIPGLTETPVGISKSKKLFISLW